MALDILKSLTGNPESPDMTEIRVWDGSERERTVSYENSKRPYPYGHDMKIVKFYDDIGTYVGEANSSVIMIDGVSHRILYTPKDISYLADLVSEYWVEGTKAEKYPFVITHVLNEFELPVIK